MRRMPKVQGGEAKPRLAVLVNAIAPYRIPIYRGLAEHFETIIFHGGSEPNRNWPVDLPPDLNALKVPTLQIPLRKQIGFKGVRDTSYVHLNFGLLWLLPRFRPDAIISNELGMRTLIALAYSRLVGTPLWVWWGGTLHSERHISFARQRLRRFFALRIKNWISYGASSTRYLEHLGVPISEVLQVQNCVPQPSFETRAEAIASWFPGTPAPVILSTGQLIQRKGLDRLIDACGRISAQGFPFTLVLIGSGPERDPLLQRATNAGIKNFHLLANQSQETLHQLYRRADIFVFPTLEDVWGLVVNEALLAGCPVLCSRYAGCAEELLPDSHIFDPASDEDFDRALLELVNGTFRGADPRDLMTCQQVTNMIVEAITTKVPMHAPPPVHHISHPSHPVSQELY